MKDETVTPDLFSHQLVSVIQQCDSDIRFYDGSTLRRTPMRSFP